MGTYGQSSDLDAQMLARAPELAGVALLEDRNEASVTYRRASCLARVAAVSDEFWSVLRMRPAEGTWPTVGTPFAAVISDTLWRSLGGSAEIVGRRITIEQREFTVAAIAPPSFCGLSSETSIIDGRFMTPLEEIDRRGGRREVVGIVKGSSAADTVRTIDHRRQQTPGDWPSFLAGTRPALWPSPYGFVECRRRSKTVPGIVPVSSQNTASGANTSQFAGSKK